MTHRASQHLWVLMIVASILNNLGKRDAVEAARLGGQSHDCSRAIDDSQHSHAPPDQYSSKGVI